MCAVNACGRDWDDITVALWVTFNISPSFTFQAQLRKPHYFYKNMSCSCTVKESISHNLVGSVQTNTTSWFCPQSCSVKQRLPFCCLIWCPTEHELLSVMTSRSYSPPTKRTDPPSHSSPSFSFLLVKNELLIYCSNNEEEVQKNLIQNPTTSHA